MPEHDLDPTDPYLLDVVRAAETFAREREKRLHGQRAALDDAEKLLRRSIAKAVAAWDRNKKLKRTA